MRLLSYAFGEALTSLRRGRWSTLLSVATVATPLVVLGAFLLASSNLERLVAGWSSAAELSVYLEDGVSDETRASIGRLLANSDIVLDYDYVDQAAALARFQADFPDLQAVLGGFGANPLPASFEVRVQPAAEQRAALESFVTRLSETRGVEDVRYDRQWLDRIALAVRIVQGLGVAFGLILILGAILTVANVIQLTLQSRQAEVEIMHLVGAPVSYVRAPFAAEGILQGGAGGLMALGLLWLGYQAADSQYGQMTAETIGLGRITFLSIPLCLALLCGGMVVGGIGGLFATRARASRNRSRLPRRRRGVDTVASAV